MITLPDFETDQRVTVYLNGCCLPGTYSSDAAELSDDEVLFLRSLSGGWYQVRIDAICALQY